MEINNPYVGKLQQAYRDYEKNHDPELKKRIADLDNKSRAYVQEQLKKLSLNIEHVAQKQREARIEYPKLSRQYKEMCSVYKQAYRLLLDVREAKKEIRELMKAQRRR